MTNLTFTLDEKIEIDLKDANVIISFLVALRNNVFNTNKDMAKQIQAKINLLRDKCSECIERTK